MLRKALVIAIVLQPVPAIAHDTVRSVTVEGYGAVSAAPDRARVNMAIEARDRQLGTAREQVVRVSRAFLELAENLGIDEAQIQSSGVTIRPEYRWNDIARRQELTGYLVQRSLDVTLLDLAKLGDLLEGAIDAGVNQVAPPALQSSRERDLHREALALAAADAEANARALARSLGATLGAVQTITTTEVPPPQPLYRERMMAAAEAMSATETYVSGEIRIESRVTVTFALGDE